MKAEQKAAYLSSLKKVIVFRFLDESLLSEILGISKIRKYEEGDKIISEGEISQYLYTVLSGCVNVSVKEASGKEVFICAIGEGDVFGEAGIFIKAKRTANVISTEDTTILEIDRKDLLNFMKKQPIAGIKMLMIIIYSLLKKLREANQELAFERKTFIDQEDIDSIVEDIIKEN